MKMESKDGGVENDGHWQLPQRYEDDGEDGDNGIVKR